jgi:hypothetical protein
VSKSKGRKDMNKIIVSLDEGCIKDKIRKCIIANYDAYLKEFSRLAKDGIEGVSQKRIEEDIKNGR